MNSHLLDLFNSNKLDEIMNQFSVEEIANQLDFKNAIKLAWRFFPQGGKVVFGLSRKQGLNGEQN